MKPSRFRTFLIGLAAGVAYAFLGMLFVSYTESAVSVSYIFILPVVLGAIPVLFTTREQLRSYMDFLVLPWIVVLTFFMLSFLSGFEGMICLVIIFGPFILLGSLGAFIYSLLLHKRKGNKTPLYASLLLPFLFLSVEKSFIAKDRFYTVTTSIEVNAHCSTVWSNVKNVKDIGPDEISTHFVHLIGVPRPLNGQLDREGVGATRSIIWEKGIKFQEKIMRWEEGKGFEYNIIVDPKSIPPTTLDEHVMIGGKYFDVIAGGYRIDSIARNKCRVALRCTYRVTTNLNFYARWWADFMLNDFNEMILEIIKKRSEK